MLAPLAFACVVMSLVSVKVRLIRINGLAVPVGRVWESVCVDVPDRLYDGVSVCLCLCSCKRRWSNEQKLLQAACTDRFPHVCVCVRVYVLV